ncbi:hypothetical protein COO60DRAFT_1181146 [Scenedesmus sp. NREL 46B-D3]|nr:hypothetical protein COO60DRAFT_1181146 [Scenedesmus sp. NREL 46B-D3]
MQQQQLTAHSCISYNPDGPLLDLLQQQLPEPARAHYAATAAPTGNNSSTLSSSNPTYSYGGLLYHSVSPVCIVTTSWFAGGQPDPPAGIAAALQQAAAGAAQLKQQLEQQRQQLQAAGWSRPGKAKGQQQQQQQQFTGPLQHQAADRQQHDMQAGARSGHAEAAEPPGLRQQQQQQQQHGHATLTMPPPLRLPSPPKHQQHQRQPAAHEELQQQSQVADGAVHFKAHTASLYNAATCGSTWCQLYPFIQQPPPQQQQNQNQNQKQQQEALPAPLQLPEGAEMAGAVPNAAAPSSAAAAAAAAGGTAGQASNACGAAIGSQQQQQAREQPQPGFWRSIGASRPSGLGSSCASEQGPPGRGLYPPPPPLQQQQQQDDNMLSPASDPQRIDSSSPAPLPAAGGDLLQQSRSRQVHLQQQPPARVVPPDSSAHGGVGGPSSSGRGPRKPDGRVGSSSKRSRSRSYSREAPGSRRRRVQVGPGCGSGGRQHSRAAAAAVASAAHWQYSLEAARNAYAKAAVLDASRLPPALLSQLSFDGVPGGGERDELRSLLLLHHVNSIAAQQLDGPRNMKGRRFALELACEPGNVSGLRVRCDDLELPPHLVPSNLSVGRFARSSSRCSLLRTAGSNHVTVVPDFMFYVRRHKLLRRLLMEVLQQLCQAQGADSVVPLRAFERAMSQPQFCHLALYALLYRNELNFVADNISGGELLMQKQGGNFLLVTAAAAAAGLHRAEQLRYRPPKHSAANRSHPADQGWVPDAEVGYKPDKAQQQDLGRQQHQSTSRGRSKGRGRSMSTSRSRCRSRGRKVQSKGRRASRGRRRGRSRSRSTSRGRAERHRSSSRPSISSDSSRSSSHSGSSRSRRKSAGSSSSASSRSSSRRSRSRSEAQRHFALEMVQQLVQQQARLPAELQACRHAPAAKGLANPHQLSPMVRTLAPQQHRPGLPAQL